MEEKTIKRAYGNPITLDIASYNKIQEEIQQETRIRLSVGRYTLNEAALYIEEHSNSNARSIFNKLKESALTDKLKVYRSGSNELYKHKHSEHMTNVFAANLEAYWIDLNVWLENNEPRLKCKFPEPIPISNEKNALSKGCRIPGKMPHTAIGKLAINAAWQIEQDTGKQATAKQVIEKLQDWVKTEPELIDTIAHGVIWVTIKGKDKPYDKEACMKTLASWNKSRS